MCGIAGYIEKKASSDNRYRESLRKMLAIMTHRGPDGEGLFEAAHVALGMRRLSIIDLSGGWQPLYSEDRSVVVVSNGEIYNYIELRSLLEGKGHVFSSHSDVETIIHLYEEYGEAGIHHLRGMFAFALYDKKTSMVMIARDRMGEKPLYYFEEPGFFLFASEMKSLVGSGLVPLDIDPAAIDQYFHFQYVPEPRTPFSHVRKLEAGHYLKIDISRWRITKTCYWNLEEAAEVHGNPAELISNELESISEIIIRSDVPVGLALSGGLDSSAIAALAVRKYPGVMNAFCVGYPGRPANDERGDARVLADYLKIPLHEIELQTGDMIEVFDEMNFMRDDPIADISGYGYYAVSRAARAAGVPVLLQGQGGDELFWGYQWVRDAVEKTGDCSPLGSVPQPEKRSLVSRFRSLFSSKTDAPVVMEPHRYRPRFIDLADDFVHATTHVRELYAPSLIAQLNDHSALDVFTYTKPWEYTDIRLTRLICETYLLQNGIAQGDRLSMANSVELRLPFVDYRLVELVIGLRKTHQHDPDYRHFPKPWLKAALRGILPDSVMDRPKRGFAPPVQEWHARIFERYGNRLCNGQLVQRGVLSSKSGEMLSKGPFPAGIVSPLSFKALVLELWFQRMSGLAS